MAEVKTWTCTKCDKSFPAGKWECLDGTKHEVELKTYYAAAGNLRTYVTSEKNIMMADGTHKNIPARGIEFIKGTYKTSDPEDQLALDVHKGMITLEQWKKIFIEPAELTRMKERELADRERKLEEREQNLLLSQVKASKQPVAKGA